MSPDTAREHATSIEYGQPIAFSLHFSRNVIVQMLGLGMVSLMGLAVLPWPAVLAWTAVVAVVVAAENRSLRLLAAGGPASRAAEARAPLLRVLLTTAYAIAALGLIARGGPGLRLFAFALMSASMVHVLMRYYRSPRILAASLAPYLVVVAVVGSGLTRAELRNGHVLGALAPAFAIALLAVQFWSARMQLSGTWAELMAAREAAEERERAAEAANRAKSQFLANMSHELRTPLNGVLGMVQALTRDHLNQAQKERVRIIRRSSENLLSVLNDLLDLSKIEASTMDLELAEFDLEHLVRGVAGFYKPFAGKRGLSFEYEVAEAARGRYRGDTARIRRILYSLCDNAVKFTKEGGVTLQVDRDGDQVVFRVADTGVGIGPDDLSRLFEGFFQVDATLTRPYSGAGIGLAVCGGLTALMGGVIDATSQLGVGSTFILRLPLTQVDEVVADPSAAVEEPVEMAADLRILAAEDNQTNQLVLKTLLAPAGVVPTIVENGREALAAWESQDWDIVLMDIQMPEMNGVEATRAIRLREQETGRARTPIIAVTANAMTHQLAEYVAAGMDAVVAKPIDMTDLFEAMELALTQAETVASEAAQQTAAR